MAVPTITLTPPPGLVPSATPPKIYPAPIAVCITIAAGLLVIGVILHNRKGKPVFLDDRVGIPTQAPQTAPQPGADDGIELVKLPARPIKPTPVHRRGSTSTFTTVPRDMYSSMEGDSSMESLSGFHGQNASDRDTIPGRGFGLGAPVRNQWLNVPSVRFSRGDDDFTTDGRSDKRVSIAFSGGLFGRRRDRESRLPLPPGYARSYEPTVYSTPEGPLPGDNY
ncbi:hypothetical protein BU26DRAFT_140994 [Trematosphaeria pertusa]|uniref:Uncharacterized protein n=1 Tax=Trematosphaeria pertusa TaxID=390896 RepID=A0A6A6IVW8_9PLEO|nr:uncharacterized protein BU26DRAFT_140994 [Trematosphaeria pertusa]KAF2254579.1 hypothetical protein BU26DRAFT_140994 [Trematosphaeria pertusa]